VALLIAELIDLLGSEGELGDNVLKGGITIEGIVLRGNVYAIKGLDVGEGIFHV
jgi:hypothetical protein